MDAQLLDVQDAQAVQEDEHDGELHDQPEDEEDEGHEAEVGLRAGHGHEGAVDLEAEQEADRVGQRHPGHQRAQQEEDDAHGDPGQRRAALVGREARRHERPGLVEDDRQGQQEAHDDGHPQVHHEAARERQEDDLAVGQGRDAAA